MFQQPGIKIRDDEQDDPNRRNYAVIGQLIEFGVSRFANLCRVDVTETREYWRLFPLGRKIVDELVLLRDIGILGIEITQKSVTVEKQITVLWETLQPEVLLAITRAFECEASRVMVEDDRPGGYFAGYLDDFLEQCS